MSKIFRISGNFQQDGKWMEPDPVFTGEIVTIDPFDPIFEYSIWVDAPEVKSPKDVLQGGRPTYRENELFCGYCDGVYDIRLEEKDCRRRYVIGVFYFEVLLNQIRSYDTARVHSFKGKIRLLLW